ncbi:barstar family protein [Microbispora hainanensis]|uniref:barstar family protein n=1 Tax=Microbispora hainanensis TaxID=568844 RepID=UPI0033CD4CD1
MDRAWTWDRPLPLRWLLLDEFTDTPGSAMGVCADINGLFAAPAQPPEAQGFLLHRQAGEPPGTCRRTTGVFHDRPYPEERPVTLVGCRPEEPLLTLLRQRSARKRHLAATVCALDVTGRAVPTHRAVSSVVIEANPSRLDPGLLDITLDGGFDEPFPDGARAIWDLWHAGRPSRRNLWAGYDRRLRHEWAGAALCHHAHDQPDRPPGHTCHLDGRFVTDIGGFYCAVGEAVNGPGGYFGWNLNALADCLRGGWGAKSPFRLVWHHAEVARRHLVPGYDRPEYDLRSWGPAVTLDELLGMFAEVDVTVELR